jgi:hypothetical protein
VKRVFLAVVSSLGGLLAQSGISPPLAGYVRDGGGALRPVYGVAGNLVLGGPVAQGILSVAFSGRVVLAKTSDSLYAFDPQGQPLGRMDAPEGPARLFVPPGGRVALACLSGTSESILWKDGSFQSVSTPDCETLAVPFVSEGDVLIFRRADGTELRTGIEGPALSIEQMGEGWYSVRQARRHLAVRVLEDRLETYRLPEAAP